MIPHPRLAQVVIDQRWHELRRNTDLERLAMTMMEQSKAQDRSSGGGVMIFRRLRLFCNHLAKQFQQHAPLNGCGHRSVAQHSLISNARPEHGADPVVGIKTSRVIALR